MATIKPAVALRNAMLQTILDRIDLGAGPGTIKIYDGAMPANGDGAPAGNLLATFQFADPVAGAPGSGIVVFNAISEIMVSASGTASWARIQDSDGNNVFDGDVKTNGGFINFSRLDFVFGGPVRINSFALAIPEVISF